MKIIIWGLGVVGKEWIKKILLHQDDLNLEVVAVTDSNEAAILENEIKNLYVKKDKLKELLFENIVITSRKYFEEIKDELMCIYHVEEEKIVCYDQFLQKINDVPQYKCVMCGNNILFWEFCGEDNYLFSKKQVIGAGRRKGLCPVCGAMDRTRYVYYILEKYTDIFEEKSVLHFAPERPLEDIFRRKVKEYITADVQDGMADMVVDITQMQFEDEKFDYIVCNHVLEHILDEKKAFDEVKRCLKKHGKLVVTVPICWDEKTYEDSGIVTEKDREKYYGQVDHVRLYGNDIEERFAAHGWVVYSYKSEEVVEASNLKRYGFIEGDCVFVLEKKA